MRHLWSGFALLAVAHAADAQMPPSIRKPIEAARKSVEATNAQSGAVTPARTPAAVMTRLYREIADIATQPDLRERLAADGSEALGTTPQEAARYISAEIARYTLLTREIGLKVE